MIGVNTLFKTKLTHAYLTFGLLIDLSQTLTCLLVPIAEACVNMLLYMFLQWERNNIQYIIIIKMEGSSIHVRQNFDKNIANNFFNISLGTQYIMQSIIIYL